MKQEEAGMTQDKPGRLTRRDFLGVAGLVTATLGLQAGLALAPIQAKVNLNEEPAPANLWARLGNLMLDEMQSDSSLYGQNGCGLLGHPVGCPCGLPQLCVETTQFGSIGKSVQDLETTDNT